MKKIEVSCPITATLNVIGGKWKSVILWYLKDKPMRFTALHRCLPNCSLKVFNADLKDLQASGVIQREVFAEVPPKVEYALTDFGKSLLPVIITLREWGVKRLIDQPELMAENKDLQAIMYEITSGDLSFLNKFTT